MKTTCLKSLLVVAAGLGAAGAAQSQTVYGELGYSAMTASLSVPLLGVSAEAKPAMGRAIIGVSPLLGLTFEGLVAGHINDDRFNSTGSQILNGNAKINQIMGLYVGGRLPLGPVELYGRVGMAQTEMEFKGLGKADDDDVSYGGGIRLVPGKNLTFSLDYMNYYNKGGAKLDGYTLSVGFRF
ncbi:MAG: outer membrane beta-barrel protein [Burkholderiaceae bacterium]